MKKRQEVAPPKRKTIEDILLWHHLDEASKRNAEVWNLGWSQGPNFIHSKTSKGKLFSGINPRTKKVSHEWTK